MLQIYAHRRLCTLEWLFLIIGIEEQDFLILDARHEYIVFDLKPQAHDGDAFATQCVVESAAFADEYFFTAEIAARYREQTCLAETVEPVRQEHHRHARGAALARMPFLSVTVEAVEHRIAQDLGRQFLSREEEAHGVEHGCWSAVVFGNLIVKRCFHCMRFSLSFMWRIRAMALHQQHG